MKKIIFVLSLAISLILSTFSVSGNTETTKAKNYNVNTVCSNPDIDYIEYVLIGDQWFEITYYSDGTIGIVPIKNPPNDK